VAKSSSSSNNNNGGNPRDLLLEIAGFLLAGLTAALAAFGAAPKRVLVLVRPEWESVGVDTRIAAFAAALSIGVGALVTQLGG